MPRAYSSDLRERVVADGEAGLGRAEAARRYRLGERTVYRWLAEARDEGRRHAKPHAGGRRPVVAGTEGVLHELATGPATRDATLAEQGSSCTRPAPSASRAPPPRAAPSRGSA